MKDSRLAPCPNSPKYVCTQGDSESHAIELSHYRKPLGEAKTALKPVFSELSRTELIKEEGVYLHYEVTSRSFASLMMMSRSCLMTLRRPFISGRQHVRASTILASTEGE